MTDKDLPAFPTGTWEEDAHGNSRAYDTSGMTLRQYAAIKLKVPDSGVDWLDEMITKSLRDEFAAKAMQALEPNIQHFPDVADQSYRMAGAMLEARKS